LSGELVERDSGTRSGDGRDLRVFAAVAAVAAVAGEAWALLCAVLLMLLGHSEHLELALYLLAFPVAVPAAILAARWLAGSAPHSRDLALVGALGALGLGAAVLTARLIDQTGSTAGWVSPRGAVVMSLGTAIALQIAAVRSGAVLAPWRERAGAWLPAAWFAGASLGVVTFLPGRLLGIGPLLLAALIGSLLAIGYSMRARVSIRGWQVPVFDVAIALAITLLATDVEFPPMPVNDNLYLGPVNDILHGRSMLVDAYSQYGVANMYVLALVFKIIPLGYGAFELFNGALWATWLFGVYAILRAARVPRALGVLAVVLVMLSSMFSEIANWVSIVGYPSTGPLRFGLPYVVVLAMVLAARRDRPTTLHAVAIATVALSAIWSFEAFVYTGATFLAACGMDVIARQGRLRRFLQMVAAALAGCIAVHAIFAIATKVRSGSWPDWAGYLEFIRVYGTQGFGQQAVDAWSAGLPMAFFYFVSALAIVAFAVWRRDVVRQHRESFVALAALTMLSVAVYTYFLGRSHVNNLHHVAPPAIALGAVWMGLLSLWPAPHGRQVRRAVLALGFVASSLVLVESVPDFLATWHRTALYRAAPIVGHGSLRDAVSLRWDNPPLDPRAVAADALLAAELPGDRRTVVIIDPNLTVEVLMRAGRVNALPISAPLDDDLVPGSRTRVLAAIERLPAGTGALLPVDAKGRLDRTVLDGLQQTALDALQIRFRLERLKTQPPFAVVRLAAKRSG
jgi:hypothetical protein